MAALFALSPNTFVTQDCAMRLPASKRSRSAWPGGLFGNSPLMEARSRTLIAAMALSMGSAKLLRGDADATNAAALLQALWQDLLPSV